MASNLVTGVSSATYKSDNPSSLREFWDSWIVDPIILFKNGRILDIRFYSPSHCPTFLYTKKFWESLDSVLSLHKLLKILDHCGITCHVPPMVSADRRQKNIAIVHCGYQKKNVSRWGPPWMLGLLGKFMVYRYIESIVNINLQTSLKGFSPLGHILLRSNQGLLKRLKKIALWPSKNHRNHRRKWCSEASRTWSYPIFKAKLKRSWSPSGARLVTLCSLTACVDTPMISSWIVNLSCIQVGHLSSSNHKLVPPRYVSWFPSPDSRASPGPPNDAHPISGTGAKTLGMGGWKSTSGSSKSREFLNLHRTKGIPIFRHTPFFGGELGSEEKLGSISVKKNKRFPVSIFPQISPMGQWIE